MNDSRNDAELVTAYLAGDRDALAAIYDRYADRLYDTATAMLRSRHDAADMTQTVFLMAAERLGQLRDRSRLKAWLFAVLRNEVYRRSKHRRRSRPTDFQSTVEYDPVIDMSAAPDPAADGGAVVYQQLAAELRDAASGLDERDQLVLELTARQGLSGDDLADALGVSVDQSYVLVHRMRDRVERSLGALAVARAGRRECADLAALLAGWDGHFGVLIRKRVARHIDSCETCAQAKRRFAAVPLIALAPALGAPLSIREAVVGAARQPTPVHRSRDFSQSTGFPNPLARRGGAMYSRLAAAAAAAVVVTVGVLLVARSHTTIDSNIALASTTAITTSSSTSVAPVSPTNPMLPPTVPDPIVTAPPTAPPPPETTTPQPTTTSAGPAVTGGFVIVTAADNAAPDVEITQGRPTIACPWSAPINIGVAVSDTSAVDTVTLAWSGPGDAGSTDMTRSGNAWTGQLDLDQVGGTWTYIVTATDAHGNSGTAQGTTVVAGC